MKNFGFNPRIIHYYNEIVRYWNKINFIRSRVDLNPKTESNIDLSKKIYCVYRIFWEKASNQTILRELEDIDRSFLKNIKNFSWKKALAGKTEKEKLSICESIPTFMIDCLLPVMKYGFLKDNLKYMNGLNINTIAYLRLNTLNSNFTLEDLFSLVKRELKNENIKYKEDSDIPFLIYIPMSMKSKIIRNYLYQEGYILFQDKASIAVIQALSPQVRDFICDMTAAPGIKTSLMAQNMKNSGRIIAGDFKFNRLKVMKELLQTLNVSNTYIVNIDSIKTPIRFENCFDRILLDAPCTGNGTFLANPELKRRQNSRFLHQNMLLQEKLFEKALKLLKQDGVLVYSTCSLYPEEGEYLISKFINRLEPLELPDWFSSSYTLNNSILPGTGRLFPSIQHTQGFFIGKFKKKEI
ncbi:MAG: RsmB/NOP family class I SAM-dependent RNA methyltransferase [Promethearchaeota archaeon]